MKKKVILFVRVSTENQELESQIESLKNAAFIDGYTDEDLIVIAKKESGIKLKEAEREGLNELKRTIERNDIDGVYLFELSRLSRDPVTLYSLRDNIFKKERIQLKCLKPSFTLLEEPDRTKFDTMGSLVFSIFGCFAEQEIIEKKERFHRGREQKAAEGKFAGGRVPFGYTVDEEQANLIVIDEEEASTIRTIYDMYEAGYSQPRIAVELQERSVKYRHYYGNQRSEYKNFSSTFISHLLRNELLTGKKLTGGGTFARSYPPIISEAQFERCRDIARSSSTGYGKINNVYYAKSLIVCPDCGSRMCAHPGSRFVYQCNNAYMSPQYAQGRCITKQCSNKDVIPINAIDSLLWYLAVEQESQYLWGSAMDDITLYETKISAIQEKMDAIQPRLKDIENKRGRIVEAFMDGDISKDIKTRKTVELDSQKLEILKQQIQYEKDIAYFQGRIDDIRRLYAIGSDNPQAVSQGLETVMDVKEKIERTDNDEEKSRLVHKHIKKVSFEKRMIPYQRKSKWAKSTDIEAKYVTVTLYDNTNRYFYLFCNNGVCSRWLHSDENGSVLDDLNIDIVKRFVNTKKKAARKALSKKSAAEYDGLYAPKDLYIRGFDAMAAFLCMSSSATARRWYAKGLFADAITVDNDGVHIMDAAKALEIMKASDNTWIKKSLEKFYQVRKKKGKKH